jgi:hypothetical protein
MDDRVRLLAKCDETLDSLAAYGDDSKLRRLVEDIEQLRASRRTH